MAVPLPIQLAPNGRKYSRCTNLVLGRYQFQAWQAMSSFPLHIRVKKAAQVEGVPSSTSSSDLDRVPTPAVFVK